MNSFLSTFFKDCKTAAAMRGNYMNFSEFPKNETKIVELYLEAKNSGDEVGKSAYTGMLLLRHWKDIRKLYEKCKTACIKGETVDDFAFIIYDRIIYALKYIERMQEDGEDIGSLNMQARINQAISTEVKNQFYFSNLDKHKANALAISTSTIIEGGKASDKSMTIEDTLVDESKTTFGSYDGVDDVVAYYTRKNRLLEAIFIERIGHGFSDEYTEKRAAKAIRNLPDNYSEMFAVKFPVAEKALCETINKIKKMKSAKIYSYMDAIFCELREKPDLVLSLRTN